MMGRTMAGEYLWPENTPPVKIGNANSKEFTPTELKVLRHLVEGYSVVETAQAMGVKESTTRYHIENLKEKIGVKSLASIVRVVTKMQLILPEF